MPITSLSESPSAGMVDRSGPPLLIGLYSVVSHIMEVGIFSTIGRRSRRARRKAVATSLTAVAGVFTCSNPAPVASTNAR
ncbi:MAG: hypothetical protein ACJ0BV_11495 [Paracoccaceae bacterium]